MADLIAKDVVSTAALRTVPAITSAVGGHAAALGAIDAVTVGATHYGFSFRAGRTPLPSLFNVKTAGRAAKLWAQFASPNDSGTAA